MTEQGRLPKEAAVAISPQKKQELTSRILDHMAQNFQGDLLYDMLHHSLGLSHGEMEALGFSLYDQYECRFSDGMPEYISDEQMEHYVQAPLTSPMTASLIASYEELLHVPRSECLTEYSENMDISVFKPDVSKKAKQLSYEKALSAMEMDSDTFQRTSKFLSCGKIVSRLRDCLLAGVLEPCDEVLFVNTEPVGGPGDFALTSGILQSIDVEQKTCSVRGAFFVMEDVPLRYVLGRHDSEVQGTHYGFRHMKPLFGESTAMADHYMQESEQTWNALRQQEQAHTQQMNM